MINVATAIRVEEVEGFLDLLLLFFGDVSGLLGALEGLLLVGCLMEKRKARLVIILQTRYAIVSGASSVVFGF